MKRFDVTTEAAGQGDYFGAMEESSDGEWIKYEEAEAAIAAAVAAEREAWESAVDSQCLPDRAHQIVVTANGNRIKAAIRARKEPTA